MRNFLIEFIDDERGLAISAELVAIVAMILLAMVAGASELADVVEAKFGYTAAAFQDEDQETQPGANRPRPRPNKGHPSPAEHLRPHKQSHVSPE